MDDIKQYPTKKRIEFARSLDVASVRDFIAQVDATSDKKVLGKLDYDMYDMIPELRDLKDQGNMPLAYTLADMCRQKETVLNKIAKGIKDAEKLEKETQKTAVKTAVEATLKRRRELPILKSVLDKMGADFYKELFDGVIERYTRQIGNLFTDGVYNREQPSHREHYKYMAYLAVAQEMSPFMLRGKTLNPEWPAILDKLATDTATYWVECFKNKLATKLGQIIDVKGKATLDIKGSVHQYVLFVSFDDGSYFTIRTQQVISVSSKGKVFARYPSTFHDVRFHDGTKMVIPSAAKMQKEFGVNINEKEEV